MFHGFPVTAAARAYLNKMVFRRAAGPMRQVIVENEFLIPANSPSDTTLKKNIASDMLELATNHVRDSTPYSERGDGPLVVGVVNLKEVLKHDLGLREIVGLPVDK